MKTIFRLPALLLLLCHGALHAQLSEGGWPKEISALKSAQVMSEILPPVNNAELLWENRQMTEEDRMLKPLRFAHPFKVHFTPSSHGKWMQSDDGWWIWQFTVTSPGAHSLNLLFENFHLQERARLFLFTPDKRYVTGAFTDRNNDREGVFATSPLPGDEITVQYEIPGDGVRKDDFVITHVNHDFLGILKYVDDRRPMGVPAESCNRDINCPAADRWREVQNSVCRIMVQGKDLCSGTLLNNTAQNSRPFVLTANHCISSAFKASGSLFLFNYESPYCGPLDGDVSHSLSGSKLKATVDSLDFALVELNTPPPPSFRPYYAGWNRSSNSSDSVASIHHPQGDIKKIAIENQTPVVASFISSFIKNGFWRVPRWDTGTTEIGSSGGPLFNRNSQLTGTLSGGSASCSDPVNDYFARFDIAWNYKADSSRQLKYWLDPQGNNPVSLSGKQFNQGEDLCKACSNLKEGDVHELLRIDQGGGSKAGYWTGTNNQGITEIAEKFKLPEGASITGLSLGVGKKWQTNPGNNSYISIKIYGLSDRTATLIYSGDTMMLRRIYPEAMNFIKFTRPVIPQDSFLVAINFEQVKTGDSIAIYHTLRSSKSSNSLFLKKGADWIDFRALSPNGYASSLAFELLACNLGNNPTGPEDLVSPVEIHPNPTTGKVAVKSEQNLDETMISVFNMLGQQVRCGLVRLGQWEMEVNVSGNRPGLYIIRVKSGSSFYQRKIMLINP